MSDELRAAANEIITAWESRPREYEPTTKFIAAKWLADAFDREIYRYEAILSKIRDVITRQKAKVENRLLRAENESRPIPRNTLLKEADTIERVLAAVRKAMT